MKQRRWDYYCKCYWHPSLPSTILMDLQIVDIKWEILNTGVSALSNNGKTQKTIQKLYFLKVQPTSNMERTVPKKSLCWFKVLESARDICIVTTCKLFRDCKCVSVSMHVNMYACMQLCILWSPAVSTHNSAHIHYTIYTCMKAYKFIKRIKAPCVAATLESSGVEIVVFFRSWIDVAIEVNSLSLIMS